MKLNELRPAEGSKKSRKRLGRGLGSGSGKTAGRGHKGQRSRSGFSQRAGWEGGRSSLIVRLPKRGFNKLKEPVQIVNLNDLNRFADGAELDAVALREAGVIKRLDQPVKLLADGELTAKGLVLTLDGASKAAAEAVTATGGKVVLPARPEEN